MQKLDRTTALAAKKYPEKIVQFGEGNFLRAFFDWMVYRMNAATGFASGVVVVQPIAQGLSSILNAQDGLFHLVLSGISNGKAVSEVTLIDSVQRALNPYEQFSDYLKLAESPDLRFMVSNTTEAGIAYVDDDTPDMQPQKSFPGKVTAFLYRRYQHFTGAEDKGLIIFCCELIDRNADKLEEMVIKYAQAWGLPEAFKKWVESSNIFCNTLVDRIVPGFPKDKIDEIQNSLGYEDRLVVEGEFFHLWVIEAPDWVAAEFPAQAAGLNVIFTDNLQPYRERKVRLLNGVHTSSFAISLLSNVNTVRESITHPVIGRFMHDLAYEEICPDIKLPADESRAFAANTLERFHNPYIRHQWRSIALNSVPKWQTRVLPSLVDFQKRTKRLPQRMVFSLAALIVYYRGVFSNRSYQLEDDEAIIAFFRSAWSGFDGSQQACDTISGKILAHSAFWQMDLAGIPGLVDTVAGYISDIYRLGLPNALNHIAGPNLN